MRFSHITATLNNKAKGTRDRHYAVGGSELVSILKCLIYIKLLTIPLSGICFLLEKAYYEAREKCIFCFTAPNDIRYHG